jgi:hypothetical protein
MTSMDTKASFEKRYGSKSDANEPDLEGAPSPKDAFASIGGLQ